MAAHSLLRRQAIDVDERQFADTIEFTQDVWAGLEGVKDPLAVAQTLANERREVRRIKAIGTGDFNHDGDAEILWRNTSTGQVSIWEMNGNALIGGGPVSANPGPAWQAIGTGDFNDDGLCDILFQNTSTGQVSVWEMNGNSISGGGPISANPGTSWPAIGTGGGGSDILFQNASGQISIWQMNGNTIAGGGTRHSQSRD